MSTSRFLFLDLQGSLFSLFLSLLFFIKFFSSRSIESGRTLAVTDCRSALDNIQHLRGGVQPSDDNSNLDCRDLWSPKVDFDLTDCAPGNWVDDGEASLNLMLIPKISKNIGESEKSDPQTKVKSSWRLWMLVCAVDMLLDDPPSGWGHPCRAASGLALARIEAKVDKSSTLTHW